MEIFIEEHFIPKGNHQESHSKWWTLKNSTISDGMREKSQELHKVPSRTKTMKGQCHLNDHSLNTTHQDSSIPIYSESFLLAWAKEGLKWYVERIMGSFSRQEILIFELIFHSRFNTLLEIVKFPKTIFNNLFKKKLCFNSKVSQSKLKANNT